MGRKGIILIIKDLIYKSILEKKQNEPERDYLGFSEIGHPCLRYLWIKYHYPQLKEPFSEKQAVIFENGHWVEKKLIHQMRQAGFDITDQQIEMNLFNGKFKGHPEGLTTIEPYGKVVFELKGLKHSIWLNYKKNGVKATSSIYYAQAIMLAGYLKLPGTYWLAESKDTQDLYEEFIESDPIEYKNICNKASSIIYGEIPQGISSRIDWWKCVNCSMNHENACRKKWKGEALF